MLINKNKNQNNFYVKREKIILCVVVNFIPCFNTLNSLRLLSSLQGSIMTHFFVFKGWICHSGPMKMNPDPLRSSLSFLLPRKSKASSLWLRWAGLVKKYNQDHKPPGEVGKEKNAKRFLCITISVCSISLAFWPLLLKEKPWTGNIMQNKTTVDIFV